MTDKQLLEQALEALLVNCGGNTEGIGKEAITAIKARLAQPEQKPVGEIVSWPDDFTRLGVEWMDSCPPEGTKLYTTPLQRTWVGLTDEQFLEACQIAERGNYMVAFQRIQQWLMEKNT